MTTFTIGSRGSLLAVAQASYIKKLLEEKTSHQFQLKIIKTKGDVIQDKPLWQIEGKDFFTRELDQALLKREIDLVVHSFKDLGGERPAGIKLGAVTERVNPADTLITTKENALKMVKQEFKDTLILGSSSPRRIAQSIALPDYLPQAGIKIDNKNLRGNVDTRLKKLLSGDYDAIVLAAAGLERLSSSEEGYEALKKLVPKLTFMFLPLHDFVPAPSQGALAIDCHEENQEIQEALKTLEHTETRTCVLAEKKQFQHYGGGCHLPIGVYANKLPKGMHLIEKGLDSEKKPVHLSHLVESDHLKDLMSLLDKGQKIFIGMPSGRDHSQVVYDQLVQKSPLVNKGDRAPVTFLATKHALENLKGHFLKESLDPLFASGSKSMKALAKTGHWCHGCANSQGDKTLSSLKNSKTFNLFAPLAGLWTVFSHETAPSELGNVIGSYKREEKEIKPQWREEIEQCEAFVFTSFAQYQIYETHFPDIKNKMILSGTGKTFESFKKHGISPLALPSYRWLYQQLG